MNFSFRPKTHSFAHRAAPQVVDWADILPYTGFYGRTLIDVFGVCHRFYEIFYPQEDVRSDAEILDMRETTRRIMLRLPPAVTQTEWHFSRTGGYESLIERFARTPTHSSLAPLRAHLAENYRRRARHRDISRIETILVLSVAPATAAADSEWNQRTATTGGAPACQRQRITKAMFERAENIFHQTEPPLGEILQKVNARFSPMNADQAALYFYELFNPNLVLAGIPMLYDYDSQPWVDAWLCQETDLTREALHFGDCWHAHVSMVGKPLRTVPFIAPELTLKVPFRDFRFSLKVRRLDKDREKVYLDRKIDQALQNRKMGLNMLDRLVSPYEDKSAQDGEYNAGANAQMTEAAALQAELRSGEEEQVLIQAGYHLWHPNREELLVRRKKLLSVFSLVGDARGWEDRRSLLPALVSNMPGVQGPYERPFRVRSRMAADMAPISRGLENEEDPVHLWGNAVGGLVPLDLGNNKHTTAPMTSVTGATGTGKSVVVNQLVSRHLTQETVLVVIDVGTSYDPLIDLVKGTRARLGDGGTPPCFNPFQVYAGTETALRDPTASELAKVVDCLEILMVADTREPLLPERKNLLETFTRQTYAQAAKEQKALVTLSLFLQRLQLDQDAAWMLERLRPFARGGRYSAWFDGPSTFHLHTQSVQFDLQAIVADKDLAAVLIPMVVLFLNDLLVGSPAIPKILIFGELWQLIDNPYLVGLVIGAFKKFRKEGVKVLAETQSFLDLEKNPLVADAIKQGTQTWILLDPGSPQNVQSATTCLGLNDGQQRILKGLTSEHLRREDGSLSMFREGLLIRGQGRDRITGRIRIELTPEEYWLFTTDAKDTPVRRLALDQAGGEVWSALQVLGQQYPLGVGRG